MAGHAGAEFTSGTGKSIRSKRPGADWSACPARAGAGPGHRDSRTSPAGAWTAEREERGWLDGRVAPASEQPGLQAEDGDHHGARRKRCRAYWSTSIGRAAGSRATTVGRAALGSKMARKRPASSRAGTRGPTWNTGAISQAQASKTKLVAGWARGMRSDRRASRKASNPMRACRITTPCGPRRHMWYRPTSYSQWALIQGR